MPGTLGARGEAVRHFILSNVEAHPADIARLTADKFGISRQGANKHLGRLVHEGALAEAGSTKARKYTLQPVVEWWGWFNLAESPHEDRVWREDVRPLLETLPKNVLAIWDHAFTEMFNNAIDHSGGTMITVYLERTAVETKMTIYDDGVGIFKKIQERFGLDDESHAVLELAKGKLTTDPANHSGEGIFFTSRATDSFAILSGGVYFSHKFGEPRDWILPDAGTNVGTAVNMRLKNHTSRTIRRVFDQFSSKDGEFGFTKTIIPVRLAQYGDDNLISRSQAKRLLAHVDRFREVILDFAGVGAIGQAFADEVFRVFAASHPAVDLTAIHTSEGVRQMIARARLTTVH